ncbi:hypothetical protein GW940_02350 [Candidatus Microgenomates bacterium]|nr:hypothetical protein [Candidatus Microgenomates bacterium]
MHSKIIQKTVDTVTSRLGNLLASIITHTPSHYSEIDKLVGAVRVKSKKKVTLSTDIDDIYYR